MTMILNTNPKLAPSTVLSAHYANAERTAVIAVTKEVAAVVISEIDNPGAWATLIASGLPIADFEEPAAPGPDRLAVLEARLAALERAGGG